MINIVARHGLNYGPEGHGSPFGMGGWVVAVVLGDCGEEAQVPVAGGLVKSHGRIEAVGRVTVSPALLIEGLDDGVLFAKGLAKAEAKHHLAIGQMSDDLANTPLSRCGWAVDLRWRKRCCSSAQAVDGRS